MLDTPMENFVSYYQIDEMSESDENDFEEDGMTMRSSPRVNQMQIFNRDVDSESLRLPSDAEEDMKLNESFEAEEQRAASRSRVPLLDAAEHVEGGGGGPARRTHPN